MNISEQRKSLLASTARIMVPWVKVTIGDYTFGAYSKKGSIKTKNNNTYQQYMVQYPNYIKSLQIVKINGQINQYTLNISYPVTQFDDPNFFEKVFSSVSSTREIVFSYGDMSQPTYVYKDEKALITKIQQSFSLASSIINYTISAVSSASLQTAGNITRIASKTPQKPSDLIKEIFKNPEYGLQNVFTGMKVEDLDKFIAGDDQPVVLETKRNISVIDYITYLVGCMIPYGTKPGLSKDIYIFTVHDETVYDALYSDPNMNGPYFKVTKTSYISEQSDAYEIDVGYNTSTIVTSFSIDQNENYSLYYDYQKKLSPREYVRRLNNKGQWEDVYAPTSSSANDLNITRPDDLTWWTKITKYPINATVTIRGLLRPATLMTHVRLNVIFPGGHKHISSGLYIITKQVDNIDESGYKTTLSLTRIAGDNTDANGNPISLASNN